MEVVSVKKAALVIAEKSFRDEEYQVPKEVFEHHGVKVVTVSTTLAKAVGKLGMEVRPDVHIDNVKASDFDTVIFVGGPGTEQYFQDPTAHQLAKDTLSEGRILGAICIAPVILARAGLLQGKKATVFPDGADVLKEEGADYTGRTVERDGSIITGSGPEAAEEFAMAILETAKKKA